MAALAIKALENFIRGIGLPAQLRADAYSLMAAALRMPGFWQALGRMLHMLCAYWGFLFMGLHVGAHWPALAAGMKRRGWLRVLAALAALYGAFAFFRRGFPEYMFLQSMFVFFDYEEPLLFFFLDYLAILAMMAWIGNMAARVTLKQTNR